MYRSIASLAFTLCLAPSLTACGEDDYCGNPVVEDATWEEGHEFSAAEARDTLVGTWEGTADWDGAVQDVTLVFYEPENDPSWYTWPDAGEGSLAHTEDACLDSLRFVLPIRLDVGEETSEPYVTLSSTSFTGGWMGSGEDELGASGPYTLSFDLYQSGTTELDAILSPIEDTDGNATTVSEVNVWLEKVE